jgi:Tfp pilus assembly protein PilO
VSLSDRDRKIIIALVPILVIVGYWFLLLAPKREEASQASQELTTQTERRDAAKAAVSASEGAKEDFSADYTQIVRLGKAIPAQVDMPSVLVQLDAAAAGTDIHFTKITTGDRQAAPVAAAAAPNQGSESGQAGTPVAAGGESAQSAPGAAAESANTAQQTADQQSAAAEQSDVTPADAQTSTSSGGGLPVGGGAATPAAAGAPTAGGLETVPLQLEFVGNFFNLADFFHRLKRFVRVANDNVVVSGRLVTVDGVRWSSDPEIFPQLRAEITASIYLAPKAQGATAGASPTGPAPATPGTTPTTTTTPAEGAPAPAAPAPTATATP